MRARTSVHFLLLVYVLSLALGGCRKRIPSEDESATIGFHGRVIDSRGMPLSRAIVTIEPVDDDRKEDGRSISCEKVTRPNGRFRCSYLIEVDRLGNERNVRFKNGVKYRLIVEKDNFRTFSQIYEYPLSVHDLALKLIGLDEAGGDEGPAVVNPIPPAANARPPGVYE